MRPTTFRADVVGDELRRRKAATMTELKDALGTSVDMTVLRKLRALGYLTSYSHAGKFYTLMSIPHFNNQGLWFHGEVGFSRYGTLRATLERLVKVAEAGHTHEELKSLLRLRVQNTLRNLVEAGRIRRELVEALYVYFDVDPRLAKAQLAKRLEILAERAVVVPAPLPLDPGRVIEVLVAVIRAPAASARQVASALGRRGVDVSESQVEEVFARYVPGKKTARSRSRRSPR